MKILFIDGAIKWLPIITIQSDAFDVLIVFNNDFVFASRYQKDSGTEDDKTLTSENESSEDSQSSSEDGSSEPGNNE